MKVIYGVVLVLTLVDWSVQSNFCEIGGGSNGTPLEEAHWQNMDDNCYKAILAQIQRELNASLTYLAMGAHFTSDVQFRPGTSAFFLEGAGEERAHAKDLIAYLLMRGMRVGREAIPALIPQLRWSSIEDALKSALNIELSVRANFMDIIEVCEGKNPQDGNDYHAADLMTGKFLEEQHESIRKIVGLLATLTKMKQQYGDFSEVMFDRTLIA